MSIKTLDEIGISTGTDKNSFGHNFLWMYEKHISKLRNSNINFLEIGVAQGNSISMWHLYFENAIIYGVDCPDSEGGKQMGITLESMKKMNKERIKIFNVDQGSKKELNNFLVDNNVFFEVIVDDGHHYQNTQQISLGVLFKNVSKNGIYVVEDIQYYKNEKWGIMDLTNYTDSTYKIFENFNNSGIFNSVFLTEEENMYIQENIDGKIEIHHNGDSNIIAFIKKK